MTVSSVCSTCGTIEKSGKLSCCGGGGSWFKNCGSTGKTHLDHTWYEGIQACKAREQSKTAIGQQLNAVQQIGFDSSDSAGKTKSNTVITSTNMSTSLSVITSVVTSVLTSPNTSATYNDLTINSKPIVEVLIAKSVNVSMTTSPEASMGHTPSSMLMNSSSNTSISTTFVTSSGCETLLNITVHAILLLIIVVV